MKRVKFEVYSETVNCPVVKVPGRHFPGVVLQGDSLSILLGTAEEVCDLAAGTSNIDLIEAAAELRDKLAMYLNIYERTLNDYGIPLPYSKRKRPDTAGWVILTTRYGSDKSVPSEGDLARAVDELFIENVKGMRETDDAEHPNAWLRYGFDGGPVYVIDAYSSGTVTFTKWGDQDDDEPESEYTAPGVDKQRILQLWKSLASGEITKIASEYPECGW